jgi:hypothetical protein
MPVPLRRSNHWRRKTNLSWIEQYEAHEKRAGTDHLLYYGRLYLPVETAGLGKALSFRVFGVFRDLGGFVQEHSFQNNRMASDHIAFV